MEKINVAELLKDCPSGMELDCTMYDDIFFYEITDDPIFPILVKRIDGSPITLTKCGEYANCPSSKCVIFPKGKTTWEGFVPPCQFKDGDVVVAEDEKSFQLFLLKHLTHIEDDNIYDGYCYFGWDVQNNDLFEKGEWGFNRLATEEEKQKLFDAIKENGYKWNPETNTLEKLIKPKFKVGDRIRHRGEISTYTITDVNDAHYFCGKYVICDTCDDNWELVPNKLVEPKFKVGDKIKLKGGDEFGIITEVADCFYIIKNKNHTHCWPIKKQDDWELINEPIFKVGDRITNGKTSITIGYIDNEYYYEIGRNIANRLFIKNQDKWSLVPNKFNINTLKPFESRVLVRNDEHQYWIPAFWGCKRSDGYTTTFGWCKYCIPFNGNEHLLETNNDCDEYFKTWKK